MKTRITANELAVLKAIDKSEYGEFLEDDVWTFTIADHSNLSGKTISGTISSLVKKGLVKVSESGSRTENTIGMTETGIKEFIKANKGSLKSPSYAEWKASQSIKAD